MRTTKKKMSRYSDLFHVAAAQPPPRQHQKFSFSKSDASKKETVHKHHRRLIIDHRFSPWIKSPLTKQCLQQGHCQTQPIKARPWIFTLQDRTLNSSHVVTSTCIPLHQVTDRQANSSSPPTTKPSFASPQISVPMAFFASTMVKFFPKSPNKDDPKMSTKIF
jgi:hypothetical protein